MQKIIKFEIYFDGKYYCARGMDADIFTQGKTLDETIANLKEAVSLHFEGEEKKTRVSPVLAMIEVDV